MPPAWQLLTLASASLLDQPSKKLSLVSGDGIHTKIEKYHVGWKGCRTHTNATEENMSSTARADVK